MDTVTQQINKKLPKDHFMFTSESVAAGHPDKMCDYISDSILDAYLAKDPNAKVACETCVKNNLCMVFGEVGSSEKLYYEEIVRNAIKEIGYDDLSVGMDYKSATVVVALDHQSPEIFNCVIQDKDNIEKIGAGDQGLMIGYASDETEECMPLSHLYASQMCERLRECRDKNIIPWLGPDAKTQVTIEYRNDKGHLTALRVHTVLISAQHKDGVDIEEIESVLKQEVIKKVIPSKYLDADTIYFINPSGRFVIGGPQGDSGLTGRKIIVDTYGGWGGHGGGAFSGKDPTKVDRSAAYAARWVAKSLVSNGFCKRAMVEMAYAIGVCHPISIYINTYGTCIEGLDDYELQEIVLRNFDLRPGCIIRDLDLKRPIYKKTASFGHFGRNDPDFTWEKAKDLSHELKKYKN